MGERGSGGGRHFRGRFRCRMDRPLISHIGGRRAGCGSDKSRIHKAVVVLRGSYGTYEHDRKSQHKQHQYDYERASFAGCPYPFGLFEKCRIGSLHLISEKTRDNAVVVYVDVLKNVKLEENLLDAKPLDTFQFLRKGYYCLDKDSTKDNLIFNRTVSLKDSWEKEKK